MITTDLIKQHETPRTWSAYANSIKAHTLGVGYIEVLEQINQYENDDQYKLRKRIAISNEFITEQLLRPFDSIWSAKGGMTHIGAPQSKKQHIIELLQKIDGVHSLRRFMKEVWFNAFVNDPNALIYWDTANPDKPTLRIISSANIKAIQKTDNKVEWVVIRTGNTITIAETQYEILLYIDTNEYVAFYQKPENLIILSQTKNEINLNHFVQVSPIFSEDLGYNISPIHKQIGLLRSHLVKNSVKEIYQFLHLYPIFWQQETICPVCKGRRVVDGKTCPACNGTGWAMKKDVSDVFLIKRSDDETQAMVPPAGYVQPDLGTMQEQRTELGWVFEQMFKSLWGTTVENGKNETATGRFIDIQPVNNKLDWVAGIAEDIETQIVNMVGKWVLPLTFKTAIITYGRRFIIESPDVILKRYTDAKEKQAPVKILDMLLEQFYTAEYQNDPQMAEYYLKLMKVEPYIHSTIQEVEAMVIPEATKRAKRYYPIWVQEQPTEAIIATPVDKLIQSLNKKSEKWQQNITKPTE